MSDSTYDAIVIGARCAGSPTAMLLARAGYRTLVVDRATFPSDTMSTHLIHPTGVAALKRWGLLEQLHASGCPPVDTYAFDFGPFTIAGSPRSVEGVRVAYAPRRTVLDKLLVDAAGAAGAEVREGFTVEELLFEDGRVAGVRGHTPHGKSLTERARVVVGADGRFSGVARDVGAPVYRHTPATMVATYTYWSDLPTQTYEAFIRPGRGWGVFPTHENLTLVVVGWPYSEFDANRRAVEASY
jgi:2-polyprenyl-6-methoxyphenol hydroxylase-like FAD-dependent oxidoreductase